MERKRIETTHITSKHGNSVDLFDYGGNFTYDKGTGPYYLYLVWDYRSLTTLQMITHHQIIQQQ
jgi:hypothetical protein